MTAFFFAVAGIVALGSAVAVVLQRNPFLAALSLILHFGALAVLYLVLVADFVAAAQVLVYAGAVMIMFLFVIAYLGERADMALGRSGFGGAVAVIAGAAIFIETLIAVSSSSGLLGSPASVPSQFGSPANLGRTFLTDYLLSFEVVSILLLVGAVGGVVLGASRLHHAAGERPRLGRPESREEQQEPAPSVDGAGGPEAQPERPPVGARP